MAAPHAFGNPHRLRFPATIDGLERGAAELRAALDERQIGGQARYNVELAFEEVVANVVRHSRAVGDIDVSLATTPTEIELTFEDDGLPFDPRSSEQPPLDADDVRIGGLGLLLVRSVTTRMDYRRIEDRRNHLTLSLPLTGDEPVSRS